MSNASNLSTLANVLDDGSSGQFLKSTGSGGVAFDTVAAGAVVYATADLLPLSGNSAGDMAYVTATNRFYINNGSGWYSVSLVNTNPNITSVADASSNTAPFTLATDQTATVITITAADPEEVPLTYGYSVTSGSLNGSTVAQGTGSNTNVFTVTPHASQDATFTITFTASDGINQATSANAFSLSFITIVADSNHTTLLATATGTSDNNNITDSSSNSHSITVTDDTYAGSFSPYRSGGYSLFFDGGDYLTIPQTSNVGNFGTGEFTVELWFKPINVDDQMYFVDFRTSVAGFQISRRGNNTIRVRNGGTTLITGSTQLTDFDTWYHILVHRNSNNELKLFVNGTQEGGTITGHTDNYVADTSGVWCVAQDYSGSNRVDGYITDLRVTQGEAITPPSGGPTERLSATSNTKFLYSGTGYIADTHNSTPSSNHSITVNGDPSTKPFSPYDYDEYSATDHGGSVYFDGTGDYLTAASDASFDFGTGNFTIETWINIPDVTSTWSAIISRAYSATGGWRLYKSTGNSNLRFYYTGNSYINATSTGLTNNTWHHIAVVRNSGTITIYVDGASKGSGSDGSTSLNPGTYAVEIGSGVYQSSYPITGYLSDLRIVNGTAVYTGGFTPPSGPLTTTGGTYSITTNVNTSIPSSNTKLHLKGTDASIIDKSQGANLNLVGAVGSTGQVRTGNWANSKTMYFDGTDDYIIGPTISDLNIGTGDFTVECWLYETTTNTNKGIWDGRSTYTATDGFTFTRIGTDTFRVWSGSALITTGSFNIQNNWNHCALVRNSGTLSIYINGNRSGTPVSNSTNFSSSGKLIIGAGNHSAGSTPNAYITGYIQDFRVSNYPRYTAADETSNIPSAPLEG